MLSRTQYVSIAAFRHQLRRFLSFSEAAANAAGLPAQQHQALLAIAGHPDDAPPTVGLLADQLLIAPHTAAELVTRMAEADLVIKTPLPTDRRRLQLTLTLKAAELLAQLTREHLTELENLRTLLEQVANGAPAKAQLPKLNT
ncbi:MAG: MarR family transcriptional regulator [Alphaproteobacteria bacterium]|nr:MAG: MarR family transcriptional regulator [Alphaproteobacteria bacterium]